MNQKQHEHLKADGFKNKLPASTSKIPLLLQASSSDKLELISDICLNTNEIQNTKSYIRSTQNIDHKPKSLLSVQKTNFAYSANKSNESIDTKNNNLMLDSANDSSPKLNPDLKDENESENFIYNIDLEPSESNNSKNNTTLSKCLSHLYSKNEKHENNCLSSNKGFKLTRHEENYTAKNSEFKHYKDNFSRNESKATLPQIIASTFQSENKKNYKINSQAKSLLKAKVYNFLERPSGWLCFIYHFTV